MPTRLGSVFVLLLWLLSNPSPSAQVATGSIVGTVRDASGEIVPGAQVTIREVNRNTTTTLVTDASGVYTAPFLVPGTYEVQVELQGFKTWIRPGVILQVTDRVRVDAALEVGTIQEATTVVASSPVVRTDSSEVGTVIEEMAIKELPLNGRNFATLVYLAPGITPGQAGENLSGASTFNPRGAANFNALGSQANSNAWLIDGIDNNEFTFNTFIVMPSVEQVREFKVLTGVFSAEFGRGAGVVSVSTKSGANQLRGTGYEFLRNEARGALDDTLILFLSDNGGNAESGPDGRLEGDPPGGPNSNLYLGMNWATLTTTPFRRLKHFTHEGGIATPLIAHWPRGIRGRNRIDHQPGHLVDLMATIVDVTGAAYPSEFKGRTIQPLEGVSLRPVFAGGRTSRTQPIFWEHEGNRAIRSGRWKLVSRYPDGWELYDMAADRVERSDLAARHPDVVGKLASEWEAWARRTNVDPWPGPRLANWGDPAPQREERR